MKKEKLIEIEKWMKLSKTDLEIAKLLIKNKNYSNSVYHSQQSSEKAVKSILVLMDEQIYEHKVATEFYDILYSKFPYEYIEEIYFKLSELKTHWLKSRYILKTRQNKLIDPLEIYNEKNSNDLLNKAKKIYELVNKFLLEKFDIKIN